MVVVRREQAILVPATVVPVVLAGIVAVALGRIAFDWAAVAGLATGSMIGTAVAWPGQHRSMASARVEPVTAVDEISAKRVLATAVGTTIVAMPLALLAPRFVFAGAVIAAGMAMVALVLERRWHDRFERRTGKRVLRERGWSLRRRYVLQPLKDTAPAQRKLAHAQSAAP
jgi:hypothetical protein